jgi:hypothetical protein
LGEPHPSPAQSSPIARALTRNRHVAPSLAPLNGLGRSRGLSKREANRNSGSKLEANRNRPSSPQPSVDKHYPTARLVFF